jgi:glutamyl-tRNA reductase
VIQQFYIVHRRKPLEFTAPEAPVWATCLRSLAFVSEPSKMQIGRDDEVYQADQAYRFLLEVICGLRSPIVGETEVFGQFKAFSQEWLKRDPRQATLVQRILNDAKSIRTQYLSHLGTQSYGSWIRKNLRSSRVHIIGAGHLVQEILPYLLKQNREVVLHVRDPRKVQFFNGPVYTISDRQFDGGAVVVAAPIAAGEVELWLQHGPQAEQIFDMRDAAKMDPLGAVAKELRSLHEIFDEIEQTKVRLQPRLVKVHAEIHARTEKVASLGVVRPQGWDDICA